MPKFQFCGAYPVVYPNILVPGEGSLAVSPGDIRELDEAPDDGHWIAADEPEASPKTPLAPLPAAPSTLASTPKVTDVNA